MKLSNTSLSIEKWKNQMSKKNGRNNYISIGNKRLSKSSKNKNIVQKGGGASSRVQLVTPTSVTEQQAKSELKREKQAESEKKSNKRSYSQKGTQVKRKYKKRNKGKDIYS